MIIRFGYDEGCDYDKVTTPNFETEEKDGNYFFLLNKNN